MNLDPHRLVKAAARGLARAVHGQTSSASVPVVDHTAEIRRFAAAAARLVESGRPVKLYLGAGLVPRPGFLNLDIVPMAPDFAANRPEEYFVFPFADMGWGLPDGSVDYVFHEDFIEHIGQLQQIQVLAEAWRVLKPGACHRVNTPDLIAAMRENSDFAAGFDGVYTGEVTKWGHVALFSHASLREAAELVGYREVVVTEKHGGTSPFAEQDIRPGDDRDDVTGNIFADLIK